MKLALICGECGEIHTEDSVDGATLVMDFKQKHLSFICQNKKCKNDNILSFENWQDESKKSPLPRIRIM